MTYIISIAIGLVLSTSGITSIYSGAAVGIFMYWLISLFNAMNNRFPIKEIFLTFYSLQFLLGPALVYSGFEEFVFYKMKVQETEYFSYLIPVFLSFSSGFQYFLKNKIVLPDREKLDKWVRQFPWLPFTMILLGFLFPFLARYFPPSLGFVFYLLEGFKFVGLFILVSTFGELKTWPIVVVFGAAIISSFQSGMFHDLLSWLLMLGCLMAFRFQPSPFIRFFAIGIGVVVIVFIQSIKGEYRAAIWVGDAEASLNTVAVTTKSVQTERGGLLSTANLAPQISRINQGWILASTMDNVPSSIPHSAGTLLPRYFGAAFLPRILVPDKLNAGDSEIFNLYSGHSIQAGTSMGLGLFTDAYVEFGHIGANFYVFCFGLLYGFILSQLIKYSADYPVLNLFVALVFIYPIRPDCETQTVLGHLFKSCFLIIMLLWAFRKFFYFPTHAIKSPLVTQ